MELSKFLNLLKRHRFTLLVIPLITVIITYFLVRQLPSNYSSKARIATGLADQSKQIVTVQDVLQESKINQEFSNVLQMMQMKTVYDQVSYKLILHDLTQPVPFKKPSSLMRDLNKSAIAHAIDMYTRLYEKREPLVLFDKDQRGLYQVLMTMGYDEASLKKKMSIYRENSSDFIDVEFESTNPELSAFVVNQFCAEFISYYSSSLRVNQLKSIAFLDSLQKQKKQFLDGKVVELKNYKIQNRILNITEQAKILYTHITDFETRYDLARKDLESYTGAIQNIESKFNPQDRKYIESTMTHVNEEILNTTSQLKTLTNQYIISNYDDSYKPRLDSLKSVLAAQINASTDKYLVNPLAAKEGLVAQKINLEVQRDMAKYSIGALKQEMDKLNRRFDSLVPNGANLDAFQTVIEQAGKEYLDALSKFNQTSLVSQSGTEFKQIEFGMPGSALPSKNMLLVILGGVISFVFCLGALFLLFFLDNQTKTSKELANKTGLAVLGSIPFISGSTMDLKKMWNSRNDHIQDEEYKNMIRSLRFEVNAALGGNKKLAITSIHDGEGKTYATLNLAYAYAQINKKVLIIDGNFTNSGLNETIRPSFFLEEIFSGKSAFPAVADEKNIVVLGNHGNNTSLFELFDEELVQKHLLVLENIFDLILIELPELQDIGKVKEWVSVSDHLAVIFESDTIISNEEQPYIDYLHTPSSKFCGWILNKVTKRK